MVASTRQGVAEFVEAEDGQEGDGVRGGHARDVEAFRHVGASPEDLEDLHEGRGVEVPGYGHGEDGEGEEEEGVVFGEKRLGRRRRSLDRDGLEEKAVLLSAEDDVEVQGLELLPEAMELRFEGVGGGDGKGRDVVPEVGVLDHELFFDERQYFKEDVGAQRVQALCFLQAVQVRSIVGWYSEDGWRI